MKITQKTDYSTLFSSLNNSGNSLGISFTDYASIKNGTYGKLLKSYYSTVDKSDKKSTESAPKTATDLLKTEESTKTSDSKETTKKKYEPKVDTLSKILSDKAKGTYNKSAKYSEAASDTGSVIDSTL